MKSQSSILFLCLTFLYHLVYNAFMNKKIQTRGRPKAFDETEALTAAMHYFWEHGYDATSVDDLLKVMGIKKSSFYATFKSKEELFSRALQLYREQNIAFLREYKAKVGAKQTMLMLLESTIEEYHREGNVRGCLLMNSGKECYGRHANLSRQVEREFTYLFTLFVDLIAEAKEKGEIHNPKTPQSIALFYINALNGLIVTIRAGVERSLIDDLSSNIKEILE